MDEAGLTLRAAYPQALATLTRLLGSVDGAEDALHDAAVRALTSWRAEGVPDFPAAWLVRTARNRLIDQHRRRQLHARHEGRIGEALREGDAGSRIADESCEPIRDDLLRQVFTCCHPEIPEDERIILTLKALGGLRVEEIARAFLVSDSAMEQRITRARRRIRDARIPFVAPERAELRDRLDTVLAVVYLIFNQGYRAAAGGDASAPLLAGEAIRIGRLLVSLFRDDAEVAGLLALMLLHHSRARARVDESGDLIPLDEQDRSRWNAALIAEGRALLERALRERQPGPYQIQAAIAAVHAVADTPEQTDWSEIAVLYRLLERRDASPVIRLNRAVAVSRAEGPEAALALLASIENVSAMQRYHHFHAVRGRLLEEVGDRAGAHASYARALDLASNRRERAYLQRRMAALGV